MPKDDSFSEMDARRKKVIKELAELGPESEFVPKVLDNGRIESFDEWYARVFRDIA